MANDRSTLADDIGTGITVFVSAWLLEDRPELRDALDAGVELGYLNGWRIIDNNDGT